MYICQSQFPNPLLSIVMPSNKAPPLPHKPHPFLHWLLLHRAPPFQWLLPLPHPFRALLPRPCPLLFQPGPALPLLFASPPQKVASFRTGQGVSLCRPWSGLGTCPGGGEAAAAAHTLLWGPAESKAPGQLSPRRRATATVALGYGRAGGGAVGGPAGDSQWK